MRTRWMAVAGLALVAACGAPSDPAVDPGAPVTVDTAPAPEPSTSPAAQGPQPPDWLGKRPLPVDARGYGEIQPTPAELRNRAFTLPDTVDMLPGDGFASRVDRVPKSVLARSSWEPRCPVEASDLRWVRLTFWGFDDARRTGELLVNADAADDLVEVFERLYAAKYPLEEMRITRADELDAKPTGDGNNTGSFTCRPIASGSQTWSEHAYGRAIDVNPFLNPYVKDDLVIPELASAYLDRDRDDPGVIGSDGAVTEAFASIGWVWGGGWQYSKDFMHFSANGR